MKSFSKMDAGLLGCSYKSILRRHYSLDPQTTTMAIDLLNYHLTMTLELASPLSFKMIALLSYNLTNININEMRFQSSIVVDNPISVEIIEEFNQAVDDIKVHKNLVKIMQFHDFAQRPKDVYATDQTVAYIKNKVNDEKVPYPELYMLTFNEVNNHTCAVGWTIHNAIMLNEMIRSTHYFITRRP